MKVFLSWSGTVGQQVAACLCKWLPNLLDDVDVFISTEGIRKGQRWASEIAQQLENAQFGIICLTRESLSSPWILFEAGAVSKLASNSKVCTLLLNNLRPEEVVGPLALFQHTLFTREDFRKLVDCLVEETSSIAARRDSVRARYDKFWPELEESIQRIEVTGEPSPPAASRSSEDILGELLSLTRQVARSVESLSSSHSTTSKGISSDQLRELWQEIMDRIGKVSPFTRSYLLEASPVSLQRGILTIGFESQFSDHVELIDNEKNRALLRTILKEMGYSADVQLVVLPQRGRPQVE